MNQMKLIIECQNCGNKVEMSSNQRGHQIHLFRDLNDNDFGIYSVDIEKNGDIEELDDIDNIETTLQSIRIDCNKCGDYIVLEDFE